MNPIRNPFSRDEYPALTDAINGVVNGQPREVEEEVTPKRMEVLNRAVKTGMAGGLRNAQSRALADRASLAITRAYATKGGKKVTGFDKAKREHEAAKEQHKTLKKAVKESQELDERIIDEVDFFQASKNWVKGKGFKTNREVSAAQVEKNYQAMKKRQEAEKSKKSAVNEGIIGNTVQRIKNKLKGNTAITDREREETKKADDKSKKHGEVWQTKKDAFGEYNMGAKSPRGETKYFLRTPKGQRLAKSWASSGFEVQPR